MNPIIPFKERVRQTAIREALNFKNVFIDYDYLICLDTPTGIKHYKISAKQQNYAHLLGVNTLCSKNDFFIKCINGTLLESDFNFLKHGEIEENVKGTVRRKINSLEKMKYLFSSKIFVEESFSKNNITCAIAATDFNITVGFSDGGKSFPKTLLKGNQLSVNATEPLFVLRKNKNADFFTDIIYGDVKDICLIDIDFSHLYRKDKID